MMMSDGVERGVDYEQKVQYRNRRRIACLIREVSGWNGLIEAKY